MTYFNNEKRQNILSKFTSYYYYLCLHFCMFILKGFFFKLSKEILPNVLNNNVIEKQVFACVQKEQGSIPVV